MGMIITNGIIVTWENPNRIVEGQSILIEGRKITAIAPLQELKIANPQAEIIDAGGQYVLPGNICAHTHFYGAFARGLNIPGSAPKDFPEILGKLWWSLDKALSFEDVRYSTLVCLIDAIRHGTTTLIDHHASPNAIDGSLDEITEAVDQAGVRACLCYEVTDRDGREKMQSGIRENRRFIEKIGRVQHLEGRLAAMFGLHASLTLSDDTLAACREAAPDGVGFHVHVAEHPVDEYDSLAKSGERVVDRLQRFGILGPNSIAVHAVHVDTREIEILKETQTWVTHQPRSNMNNAVGVSQPEAMLRMGIKVCLGNDGFSNAMWEEWKTAYLVHKLWNHDPRRMSATDVAQMAIYHNAELATHQFNAGPIGIITPGAQGDLIFVDYHPFTQVTPGNLPWHIVFGFHESMITTTIVAGRVLMRNRELLTLDEEKITYQARKLSGMTWERFLSSFEGK